MRESAIAVGEGRSERCGRDETSINRLGVATEGKLKLRKEMYLKKRLLRRWKRVDGILSSKGKLVSK